MPTTLPPRSSRPTSRSSNADREEITRVSPTMKIDDIVAIDVHVHLEHEAPATAADEAAREILRPGHGRRRRACARRLLPLAPHGLRGLHRRRAPDRPAAPDQRRRSSSSRAANPDIALPFVSVDPTRGRGRRRRGAATGRHRRGARPEAASAAAAVLRRTIGWPTRSTKCSRRRSCPCSSTPDTAASAPACRAAAAYG